MAAGSGDCEVRRPRGRAVDLRAAHESHRHRRHRPGQLRRARRIRLARKVNEMMDLVFVVWFLVGKNFSFLVFLGEEVRRRSCAIILAMSLCFCRLLHLTWWLLHSPNRFGSFYFSCFCSL